MDLVGNTVLITGGGSGIGLGLATELLRCGNTVIVTGRNQSKLDEARSQLPKLHTMQSDVSKPKDVQALRERVLREFPDLNVVVNNAGYMRWLSLRNGEGELDELTSEIDTNLKGTIWMVSAFIDHLKTRPQGAVVNVSTGLAFMPRAIVPIYCATKAALHSYSQSLRAQLHDTNIKVFEILAPTTQTDALSGWRPEELKSMVVMPVDKMVNICLKGIGSDRYEIRPGQSNQLWMMSRVAPGFIFKQLNKGLSDMLAYYEKARGEHSHL